VLKTPTALLSEPVRTPGVPDEGSMDRRQVGTEPTTTSIQGLQAAEIYCAVSKLYLFIESPDGHPVTRSESGAGSEMSPGVESESMSQKITHEYNISS
jgi:hypothetical protein